ncbi:MAG: hypothetical protein ACFFAX_07985 [Promethearchaeota archaeon]
MGVGKIPEERGSPEFVFLSFYRLKTMSDEEKTDWFRRWADIRSKLPQGIKIVTEAGHAFGTEYTGFTVYEGPINKFEELMSILRRHTADVVEKTKTIIGTKGLALPTDKFQRILESRPID